jgi:hypothetical protein
LSSGGSAPRPAGTWWTIALLFAVPIAFGLWSVRLGRDANWDLQNYHWYDPYALLNGRYDRDVAPAMGMSFFAPLVYVPWFLLGSALPARAFGFAIGAVQSANLLLLYFLALVMLPVDDGRRRAAVALLIAAAGMGGGMSMGLLGTTFVDSVVTIGILGSLLAVLAMRPTLIAAPSAPAAWRAGLAAIPAAIAVSGKLTVAPFVAGLAAGFFCLEASWCRRLWLLLWFGIGGTATAAILLGPWLMHVWRLTGDPFYPFFARFFDSPFGGNAWSFERWMPRGPREVLLYPYVIARAGTRVAEVPFTDFRLAAAYTLIPAALGLRLLRRRAARPPLAGGLFYLLAAMAVGYALWLPMFAYYRYAVTLELLAPLAVTLCLIALPLPRRIRWLVVGASMAVLVVTTRPADWGRLPWTDRFVEASVPPIEDPGAATVLLLGQPISYVVPSLPPEVAVVDLEMSIWDGGNREAWARVIRAHLASRTGPVHAIFLKSRKRDFARAAAPFGLSLDRRLCRRVPTNLPSAGLPSVDVLWFCTLQRSDPPSDDLALGRDGVRVADPFHR